MIRNILIAAYCIAQVGALGHYGYQITKYVQDPQCEWAMIVIKTQEGK